MNYHIIGGDGQEYGPVSEGTIREWIADGRLDGNSKVRAEGSTEWGTVGSTPEFTGALASSAAGATSGPAGRVDVANCISVAFSLFGKHWLAMVLAAVVAGLVTLACNIIGIAGQIIMEFGKGSGGDTNQTLILIGMPIYLVGSLLGTVLGAILGGGIYRYLIRIVRGGHPELSDLFAGFREKPVPLAILGIVQGLIIAAGILLCVVPGIYLAVAYAFSIPLVMEKDLSFWDAMEGSRKAVTPQWFPLFAICLITLVFVLIGALLCGVGMLAAYPICGLMFAKAYCDLFDAGK